MSKSWRIQLPNPPSGVQGVQLEISGAGRNWDRAEIQRSLRAVRDCGNLICLCRDDVPASDRALHSRKLPSAEELTIARNSDTGPAHAGECYFFKERPSDSGRQCYVDDVVIEKDDGTVLLRLATTLRPRKPKDAREEPTERKGGGARSQRAMTQGGFLDFLFDRAGVNVWKPEFAPYRTPDQVLWKLLAAADDIRSARKEIASHMAICWQNSRRPPFSRWAYAAKTEGGFRGMILGVLSAPPLGAPGIVLEHAAALDLEIALDEIVTAHLNRSYPIELGRLLLDPQARVFALLTCDFSYRNQYRGDRVVVAEVVDGALIGTEASSGIPVASSYELRMAQALIGAKRRFRKPLRYDADEDVVFPDFILTDRGPDIAVEVWGRDDELYLERRRAKEAYYAAEYGRRFIGWNAVAGDPLPQL